MEKNIFLELEKRGIIEQFIDRENLIKHLDEGNVPFYIGIDPTADSLHIGHYVGLMVASYLQKAGHSPLILIGGGTAAIGDPSGKTDLRRMMTREEMDENVEKIKKQIARFVNFEGENAARIVNNADWLLNLNYIDFMREIGSKFSVNRMLAAECYKTRLETGLTFFEMGYMLLQSYDFLHLYNQFGCKLEIGGNDQWSNIIGGAELIRKLGHDDAFAFTFKLLTTKEGKKMGKTEKGALWLSAEKLTPFEFFQYLRNIDDEDIEKVYKMVSITDIEEIEDILKKETNPNIIKEKLAYDITKRVHGKEEADKALNTAREIFSGKVNTEALPVVKATIGENMLDVCIKAGFGKSRGDIKKLIASNSISLGEKLLEVGKLIEEKDFEEGKNILKKGKKVIVKLEKE